MQYTKEQLQEMELREMIRLIEEIRREDEVGFLYSYDDLSD